MRIARWGNRRLKVLAVALNKIVRARDHHADHASYPTPPNGPTEDQCFDDWAAEVAEAALKQEVTLWKMKYWSQDV